jgi:TRAP transporter TAXI family solute receptor
VSTQGSVQNIQDLSAGTVDLALCQADVANGSYTGATRDAERPSRNLRAIANLFTEAVHAVVLADAGIRGIAALEGRPVSVGEADSGTLVTAKTVLRSFGLGLKDVKPVYEKLPRSAEMLAAREIDAFFMVGGPPIATIAHIAERVPVLLLPIKGKNAERILDAQPFFRPTTISADVYKGVPVTETVGVGAQLLVLADFPDELVYGITRALWDARNRKLLDSGHRNARQMQLASALDRLSVPLHPGAGRFYKERGIAVEQL